MLEDEEEKIDIVLTKKEQKAIERLRKVLNAFPKTLTLFGWSGTLCVLKEDKNGLPCLVENDFSVSCDGGDPTAEEINQNPEIDYK